MLDALLEAVRARQLLLFVGSGVSAHLGLPDWRALVGEMANQVEYDPDIFELHGDFLQLAEFLVLKKGSIGPLRSWMDREWHPDPSRVDKSRVHQALFELDAPLIYTTNYDRWLETLYGRKGRAFKRIAHVGDFTALKDSETQIIKFHGDFEDDKSLVVTESDYFERLGFESPLDIKFRSDCIGRTILFIGYSLKDINIRYLLYKLQILWDESRFSAARPRSYIFLGRPNPVQQEILEKRGIHAIVSEHDDPSLGLIEFLERLVRESRFTLPLV